MNENAKRRQELLENTRDLYSDKERVPAIHPRYGSVYHELYKDEETPPKSSLKARIILAMLLFVLFAAADYNEMNLGDYSCEEIAEVVSQNIEIQEVWKE